MSNVAKNCYILATSLSIISLIQQNYFQIWLSS